MDLENEPYCSNKYTDFRSRPSDSDCNAVAESVSFIICNNGIYIKADANMPGLSSIQLQEKVSTHTYDCPSFTLSERQSGDIGDDFIEYIFIGDNRSTSCITHAEIQHPDLPNRGQDNNDEIKLNPGKQELEHNNNIIRTDEQHLMRSNLAKHMLKKGIAFNENELTSNISRNSLTKTMNDTGRHTVENKETQNSLKVNDTKSVCYDQNKVIRSYYIEKLTRLQQIVKQLVKARERETKNKNAQLKIRTYDFYRTIPDLTKSTSNLNENVQLIEDNYETKPCYIQSQQSRVNLHDHSSTHIVHDQFQERSTDSAQSIGECKYTNTFAATFKKEVSTQSSTNDTPRSHPMLTRSSPLKTIRKPDVGVKRVACHKSTLFPTASVGILQLDCYKKSSNNRNNKIRNDGHKKEKIHKMHNIDVNTDVVNSKQYNDCVLQIRKERDIRRKSRNSVEPKTIPHSGVSSYITQPKQTLDSMIQKVVGNKICMSKAENYNRKYSQKTRLNNKINNRKELDKESEYISAKEGEDKFSQSDSRSIVIKTSNKELRLCAGSQTEDSSVICEYDIFSKSRLNAVHKLKIETKYSSEEYKRKGNVNQILKSYKEGENDIYFKGKPSDKDKVIQKNSYTIVNEQVKKETFTPGGKEKDCGSSLKKQYYIVIRGKKDQYNISSEGNKRSYLSENIDTKIIQSRDCFDNSEVHTKKAMKCEDTKIAQIVAHLKLINEKCGNRYLKDGQVENEGSSVKYENEIPRSRCCSEGKQSAVVKKKIAKECEKTVKFLEQLKSINKEKSTLRCLNSEKCVNSKKNSAEDNCNNFDPNIFLRQHMKISTADEKVEKEFTSLLIEPSYVSTNPYNDYKYRVNKEDERKNICSKVDESTMKCKITEFKHYAEQPETDKEIFKKEENVKSNKAEYVTSYKEEYDKIAETVARLKLRNAESAKCHKISGMDNKLDKLVTAVNTLIVQLQNTKELSKQKISNDDVDKETLNKRCIPKTFQCKDIVPADLVSATQPSNAPFLKRNVIMANVKEYHDVETERFPTTPFGFPNENAVYLAQTNTTMPIVFKEDTDKCDETKQESDYTLNREQQSQALQIKIVIPSSEQSTEITPSLSNTALIKFLGGIENLPNNDCFWSPTCKRCKMPSENGVLQKVKCKCLENMTAENMIVVGLTGLFRLSSLTISKALSFLQDQFNLSPLDLLSRMQVERPPQFICNICNQNFKKSSDFENHMKNQHASAEDATKECCVCRHLLEISAMRRQGHSSLFRCRYCCKEFTRAYCCTLHEQVCARNFQRTPSLNDGHAILR